MGQRTAEEVVKGWMDSPGHRANIMDSDFTHIGIGYDKNGTLLDTTIHYKIIKNKLKELFFYRHSFGIRDLL